MCIQGTFETAPAANKQIPICGTPATVLNGLDNLLVSRGIGDTYPTC